MITWDRHSERAIAAATAVLLQVAVYLALTERHAAVPHPASAPTIIAMILAAVRPKREPPPARQPLEVEKLRLTVTHPPIRDIPSNLEMHALRSPFDWQGAIRGEVRQESAHAAAPPRMRFELPKMPVQESQPREWEGWDDTRINRVQRLAHGIIDLGHGCYMLLFPPIPQCHSEPADGHLFDHLRDRRDELPGALP